MCPNKDLHRRFHSLTLSLTTHSSDAHMYTPSPWVGKSSVFILSRAL
jgi:hypothetical protein